MNMCRNRFFTRVIAILYSGWSGRAVGFFYNDFYFYVFISENIIYDGESTSKYQIFIHSIYFRS